jgi:hypothetical protein
MQERFVGHSLLVPLRCTDLEYKVHDLEIDGDSPGQRNDRSC